ncbi:MAG TPA: TraR/DksA C4-type zinc finger protein [Devosia sp.]|nr:TraR/DksA C4-type zinc finger protein [Devosia sp.]
MYDMNEMAEAYEQARTAADQLDRASAIVDAERIAGVSLVRAQLQGSGSDECLSCGADIPQGRREAAPWATLCVACQEIKDAKGAHRRG